MTLECWYEFASTYSYLAVSRAEDVARAAGVAVAWRPFLLGPIFAAQGWNDSPFNLYEAKGRYMWRDMERRAAGYGLPFRRPSRFPRNGLVAARVALVADAQGWCGDFSRAVYRASFADDREIGEPAVVADIIRALGHDSDAVLVSAQSPGVKDALREQTAAAQALGIFGAPTFVARGELFWGDDRLADALAWLAAPVQS